MSIHDRHSSGHRGRNARRGHPSGARPTMGGTALYKDEARRSRWTPARRMVSGPHGSERGSVVGRKGVGPRAFSAGEPGFGVPAVDGVTRQADSGDPTKRSSLKEQVGNETPLVRLGTDLSRNRLSQPRRVKAFESTGPKSWERCRVQPVQPPFRVRVSRQLALPLSSEGGRSLCMCHPARARGRGSPTRGVRTLPSDAPGYERQRTRPGCQTAGPPPTHR
jgi:hypothetical protein